MEPPSNADGSPTLAITAAASRAISSSLSLPTVAARLLLTVALSTVKTPTVAAPHTNRSRTARQPSQAILQGTELPSEFAPEREKRTGKRTGKKERERARSPDGASLGGKRKRARAAKRRPAKRAQPAAELVTAADDDAFQKFAAIYPRKVELDDAREEFAKALEGGADAEAVVARAAVYAVERAQAIAAGDDQNIHPIRRRG